MSEHLRSNDIYPWLLGGLRATTLFVVALVLTSPGARQNGREFYTATSTPIPDAQSLIEMVGSPEFIFRRIGNNCEIIRGREVRKVSTPTPEACDSLEQFMKRPLLGTLD